MDQVNGHINAIHDDSIELTEFTGHFSPFNLDELELKVCKLADHYKGENDPTQDILALQQNKFYPLHDSDTSSGQQNIEDLTDMGFNMPNYSPIPAVGNTVPQQPMDMRSGASVPTSMPRPQGGSRLNTSDPTYNRGKAQIINSFTDPQEPQEQETKSSKGGKKKSSQGTQSKN